ncbi:MAG: glycosyltransferase family 4 protein [Verrucomicrobiota bacterium]
MLNWRDPKNPLSGGAERVSQAYLAGLLKRGHEVCWFAYDFPGAQREEVIDGITIVRGGGKGTAALKAKQWYRAQKPFDLVIDQHHGIPWYAPWWCRTNCIAYLHEVLGPIWDAFYPWPFSAVGKIQERWTHWFYRGTTFMTASAFTKQKLHEHGVREVKIIPYGVDTVAVESLEEKPLNAPLRLAVASRLAPNKRIDHAIRTVDALRSRKVAAELVIIGTGAEEERLKRLVGELNLEKAVRFTGHLPEAEKDKELRRAHFLLHNSQREGWGLNVIEANAMGTPAAVYPVAGLVESTLHDETGLVSKAETPESLAEVLAQAVGRDEAYQRWRVNAWNRAKTFHWNQVLPLACDWLEERAKEDK